MSNITIPKSRRHEFENRLIDYQRVHNRGQFGVSVILGATSEDLAGNITYFSLRIKLFCRSSRVAEFRYRMN